MEGHSRFALPMLNRGEFPSHVNGVVQYGASLKGLMVYLLDYQLLPVRAKAHFSSAALLEKWAFALTQYIKLAIMLMAESRYEKGLGVTVPKPFSQVLIIRPGRYALPGLRVPWRLPSCLQ